MAAKPATSGLVNCVAVSAGKELPASFEIISVSTYKQINRIPYAIVTMADGDASVQDFKNSVSDQLEPGKEFEIKAGFDSEKNTIFKGMITKIGIKVSAKTSLLIVECHDKATKLSIDRDTKIYNDQKDSDIFSALAGDAGLSLTSDPTTVTHKQIIRYNATAWDFIVLRAQANGLVVIADDNALSVKKPDTTSSPVLTLDFGTNIIAFEAQMDATSQLKKVKTASWDNTTLAVAESEASAKALDPGKIASSDLAGKVSSEYSMKHTGQLTTDELKAWADAISYHHQMSKIQGVFKCFGFAGVVPGNMMEVKGIGELFSDKLYVTGVNHEIAGGGWTTSVQVGFPSKMFSDQFDYQPKKAGGLLPAVSGLMCGKIAKITDDPDSQYRFSVELPALGSDVLVWARYVVPDGGKGRGLVFFPEVGDEVVLGFLDDDPRFPVILGAMFSSTNTPPIEPEKDNPEKGIYSIKKLKLVVNDKDEKISIETPNKNNITIDNKSNEVQITDSAGNKIKLSSSGVEISSASNLKISAGGNIDLSATGNLTVGGVNVEMSAQASFKAKGNAGANLESSGIAVVKGSLVQIN